MENEAIPQDEEERRRREQAAGTPAPVPAAGSELRTTGSIAGPPSVQTMAATGTPAAEPAPSLGGQLSDAASQWLAQPSRFDNALVQQGFAAINAESERGKTEGLKNLDERMSSRGLVGSSIEGDATTDFLAQVEDDRLRRMWEVGVTQANTLAQDRAQAGNFALGVQGQSGQLGLQERALQLQAQGLTLDEAFRRAQMEQQSGQFGQNLQLQRESLVGSQTLQARALELQQQGMSMQDALARAQMEQQGQQFGQNLGLQRQALDLERQGMARDDAYRYAALSQDASFRNRALDLQQQGMTQDDAFRQAELEWRQQYGERQQDTDYLQTLINFLGANIDGISIDDLLGMTGDGTPDPNKPGGDDPNVGEREPGDGETGGLKNDDGKAFGVDWTKAGVTAPAPNGTAAAPDDLSRLYALLQQMGGAGWGG